MTKFDPDRLPANPPSEVIRDQIEFARFVKREHADRARRELAREQEANHLRRLQLSRKEYFKSTLPVQRQLANALGDLTHEEAAMHIAEYLGERADANAKALDDAGNLLTRRAWIMERDNG